MYTFGIAEQELILFGAWVWFLFCIHSFTFCRQSLLHSSELLFRCLRAGALSKQHFKHGNVVQYVHGVALIFAAIASLASWVLLGFFSSISMTLETPPAKVLQEESLSADIL